MMSMLYLNQTNRVQSLMYGMLQFVPNLKIFVCAFVYFLS